MCSLCVHLPHSFHKRMPSSKHSQIVLTTLDFYRNVAPLVAAVGDGHTALYFPYKDAFKKDMPRFPLMVSVDANDSTITTRGTLFGVPEGAKIVRLMG